MGGTGRRRGGEEKKERRKREVHSRFPRTIGGMRTHELYAAIVCYGKRGSRLSHHSIL